MKNDSLPNRKENASAFPASGQGRGWNSPVLVVVALVLAGCAAYAYVNRVQLARLAGPPAVTLKETYPEKPDGPKFDHSIFDAVLKKHVDIAGLVNYLALKDSPGELDRYIASLAQAPLSEMGRNERLALLINAYNALTLRLIIDHHPVKSIRDIPSEQRWDAKRWNVGGNTWSLTELEHEQIRPHFREPRIHFALVCAAIACPPLRNEAFTADRLEAQLEDQTRYIHTHDRWFQYDSRANNVKMTSLYKWYGSDFEQVADSVAAYAANYSPALKQAISEGRKPSVEFLSYDWSLNHQAP
ncbi:MAG TPA: DUF547 domain-containing protein [Tepidisphaeraceae bacterium]